MPPAHAEELPADAYHLLRHRLRILWGSDAVRARQEAVVYPRSGPPMTLLISFA